MHGSEITFLKFLGAASFYKADTMILGGDITGKAVVPLIKRDDGTIITQIIGKDYSAKSPKELEKLLALIKDLGYYDFATTTDDWAKIASDRTRSDELFVKLASDRLRHWAELAREKLPKNASKIFAAGGNDDPFEIDEILRTTEPFIYCHDQIVDVAGHEMICTGYANMTPWHLPRDTTEENLTKVIDDMASRVGNMPNAIFNIHAPPYQSKLDEAPRLDKDLKARAEFVAVGSTAVRSAIDKYQPLLGLHGHIHESRGAIMIGRTLCVNPGSEYGEGILRGAVINIEPGKVKGHILTSG
jgi:Icc-related predicted phosphoesterase